MKQDVFTQIPPLATKCNIGKNLKILHFDPAAPPGACTVTEVLAILTKMNWHSKCGNCMLNISKLYILYWTVMKQNRESTKGYSRWKVE